MRPAAAVPSLFRPVRPIRAGTGAGVRTRRAAVRAAALLAAVTVGPLLGAGPAAAAPGAATGPATAVVTGTAAESATAAAPPPAARPHCALAAGAGQPLRCFATFREAVALATGGRVTTAPASPAAAAQDPAFTAAIEAPATTYASYLLGYEYSDLNWTGGSLALYGSGRCDASSDADFRFPSMPSGWNDRISSFRSYNNCAQQLFRGTNFSGGALTYIVTNMSYVGSAANDQASSVTFN